VNVAGDAGVIWRKRLQLSPPPLAAGSGEVRRHLALCGFMGVGKSTLAQILAPRLQRLALDVDAEAEVELGCSIQECFRAGQQQRFRDLEGEIVARALQGPPSVLALGGGALLRPETLTRLLDESILVYLHVPWEELREWIQAQAPGRPLIQGADLEQIGELLSLRLPLYRRAHLEVRAGREGADVAAEQVLGALFADPAEPAARPLEPGS